MVLIRKSGCVDDLERFVSSTSLKKKSNDKNYSSNFRPKPNGSRNESLRSQVKKTVPITLKKSDTTISRSIEEDLDLDIERCFDDKECLWLSSDCSSPAAFGSDYLISWLSTLENLKIHLGTGENLQEDLKNMEQAASPLNSSEKNSDSSEISSTDRTSLSASLTDIDGASLVNLDGEDSKWIPDTDSELEFFQSGFPSPYCRSSWSSEVMSSNANVLVHTEVKDNDLSADKEDANADDEPLFWPFDCDHDWKSEEAWKLFSMSPRKSTFNVKTPDSNRSQPNGRKLQPQDGCRRRLLFNSGSAASKILELKQRNSCTVGVKKIDNNMAPTRSKKSTNSLMKVVPLDIKDETTEPMNGKQVRTPKSFSTNEYFLKDNDFGYNGDLPIETFLGLSEFDGHEGIDSDLNEDIFFMEASV